MRGAFSETDIVLLVNRYNFVGGTTFKKSKAIISISKTIKSVFKLDKIAFEILNKG